MFQFVLSTVIMFQVSSSIFLIFYTSPVTREQICLKSAKAGMMLTALILIVNINFHLLKVKETTGFYFQRKAGQLSALVW